MTASLRSSRAIPRICPARRCAGACSNAGSHACRMSRAASPKRQRFQCWPSGFFPKGTAAVQTTERRLCLLVALERTRKIMAARPVDKAGRNTPGRSPRPASRSCPAASTRCATGNGIGFTEQPRRPQDCLLRANAFRHDLRERASVRHGAAENGERDRASARQDPITHGSMVRAGA